MKTALVDPKTKQVVLGPLELLATLDRAVRTLQGNADESQPALAPEYEDRPTYVIHGPLCWPYLVPNLAVTGQNEDTTRVPCRLLVGTNRDIVLVSGNPKDAWSERADFTMSDLDKPDLNYERVSQGFARYCAGMKDRGIAISLLEVMMGTNAARAKAPEPAPKALDRDAFLAGMAALMFGVEASRFPSALVTGLLLLDLIIGERTYGRGGAKRFTLANAFHAESWDDGEWYGGKYPYAVHGTGSGNMVKRNQLAGGARALLPNLQNLPQRHAVPRREVTLLVHWLEAMLDPAKISGVTEEDVFNLLMGRLAAAYRDRTIPALPKGGGPWPDTGVHALALGALLDLTRSGVVFWYEGGLFYHYDVGCKLFPITRGAEAIYLSEYDVPPEWLAENPEQPLLDWQARKVATFRTAQAKLQKYGTLQKGNAGAAKHARKRPCPKCGRDEPVVERERWKAEQERQRKALAQAKLEARQKKAALDPDEGWRLKLDQLCGTFAQTGQSPVSRQELMDIRMKCPTTILLQYSKRLNKMMDTAK